MDVTLCLFEPSSEGDLLLHHDLMQGGCPHQPSPAPVGFRLVLLSVDYWRHSSPCL